MGHDLSDWPREVLYYGNPEKLPQPLFLHSGPLKIIYENGSIRQIKYGSIEVIRMIYSAVRDQNWGTFDFVIENEVLKIKDDSFKISYTIMYHDAFKAICQLEGNSKGMITFQMIGEVLKDFKKNRIGFCVLHPIEECMGQECIINYAEKDSIHGKFPSAISPDAPFKNIRSMKWKVLNDVEATIGFEGDIFEMEDQRNWTDASYKTFCTPLDLPYPVLVKKGTIIRQKIIFRLSVNKTISSTYQTTINSIDCDFTNSMDLPDLGLTQSSEIGSLTSYELDAIRQLRLDHLRFDIHLIDINSFKRFDKAFYEAEQTGCKLELCLHFSSDYQKELVQIMPLLISKEKLIKSLVLFSEKTKTTDNELLEAIVPVIRVNLHSIKIGAGTDAFFAELNMHRMKTDLLDFVIYSVNPQVHVSDNQSMIENLLAQKHTVQSVRLFSGKADIFVSPVTLKMRFNPDTTTNDKEDNTGDWSAKVDPRQMSLFTLGWTVGSLASFACANTRSITYFETTGICGVMQGDQINRFPDLFYSIPRMLYPVYHLFRILGCYKNAKVYTCELSDPLSFSALMLSKDKKYVLIISNLTNEGKRTKMSNDIWKYKRMVRFNADTFFEFAFDNNYIVNKTIVLRESLHEINLLPFETIVLFSFC